MSRHLWYAVSAANPDMRVAGPFEQLVEAERACLLRLDHQTALRAMVGGAICVYYIPRLFEVTEVGATPVRTAPPPVPPMPLPPTGPHPSRRQRRVELPRVVYTYTRQQLCALCTALSLAAPERTMDKSSILAYMTSELASLAGSVDSADPKTRRDA